MSVNILWINSLFPWGKEEIGVMGNGWGKKQDGNLEERETKDKCHLVFQVHSAQQ